MPIVWKDAMSVGNTIIDDEHKLLICLINSVEIALKTENHGDMVRFLVRELHLYTQNHFTQEEKIMMQYKYPDYADHKKKHQEILVQLEELQDRLDKTANDDVAFLELEDDIVGMLRSWIIDHVLKVDLKIKSFFISAQTSVDQA